MIKRFMLILLFLFIFQSAMASPVCENADFKRHIPIPPSYKVVSKREIYGLCEVILEGPGGRLVSIYASPDFVIAGIMFVNKKQVSREKINAIRSAKIKEKFELLKNEVDKVVAITYKPEHVKGTIYVFTGPLCPFCHRAERHIKEWADNYKVEFKIIFFPIHLPKGKNKAIRAVCEHIDLATYLTGKWEDKTKLCEKGKKLIARSIEIGRKIGIRGVPTFISDQGETVQGFDIEHLKSLLLKISSRSSK